MVIFGLEPEIFVFYVSVLNMLVITYLSYQYYKIRKKSSVFTMISRGIDLMLLSIIIFVLTFFVGSLDDAFSPVLQFNIFEESVYSIGYFLYLSLWFYGNNTFINQAVRIPSNRRKFLTVANFIINILIGILLVLIIISSFSFFISDLQNNELYFDLITLLFGVSSQIAVLIFTHFIYHLNKERNKNRSKLSKSRLQLVMYSITCQVAVSASILIGILFLLFSSTSQNDDRFIEAIMFSSINLFLLISYFVLISSLTIPSWVRNTYDLNTSRFSDIQRLYEFLPEE